MNPQPFTDEELAQTRRAVAHAIESGGIVACSLEWALTFQDALNRLDKAEAVCRYEDEDFMVERDKMNDLLAAWRESKGE